jgi:hypothetical protein
MGTGRRKADGGAYRDGLMSRYGINYALQTVKLAVDVLERLPIVDAGALEQLIGLEGEDAGCGEAGGIARLEIDEGRVSQAEARMIELAALGARLHDYLSCCYRAGAVKSSVPGG